MEFNKEIIYFKKKISSLIDRKINEVYISLKIKGAKSLDFSSLLKKHIEKHPSFVKRVKESFESEDFNLKNLLIDKPQSFFRLEIDEYNIILYKKKEDSYVVFYLDNHFIEKNDTNIVKLLEIEKNLPKPLNTTTSINVINSKKMSLSRFGDGELNLIQGKDIGFQKASSVLTNKLVNILKKGTTNNLLVTIPEFNSNFNNIIDCFGELSFWENYWYQNFIYLQNYLNNNFYGNTDISRNTVFYENNLRTVTSLWDTRNVVFVYGNNSRFDIEHNLFSSVKSKNTIKAPAKNAFESYDEIFQECIKYDSETLFLISLGPTATILASELSELGYQALDIGHINSAYEQFKGKIKFPESLPLE